MISKKSSSSSASNSGSKKESLKTQQELFAENQKIIVELEESCMSRIQGAKIDSANCLEALEEITERKLGEIKETKELQRRIIEGLNQLKTTDYLSVNKMIIFRNTSAQSVTSLTDFKAVLKPIQKYILESVNPLTSVCTKIFYSYVSFICSKHQQQGTKQLLKITIRSFLSYISQCIYHIFRPLFLLFEKKKIDVLKVLKEQLAPVIITQTLEWKGVYPKIMKVFGRKHLKVLRDKQPSYFQMHDEFNCQSCPNPFIRTIVNLQQLDSTHSVKQKLRVLQEIKDSIQEDIKDHQESTFIEMDVTTPPQQDLLPCLQYCIMKSDRGGIVQSMQYIELFYEKSSKKYYDQQFLDKKGVNHIIKSLKSAGVALRDRDTELEIMHTYMENM